MSKTPLLIFSDTPSSPSGLSRITRELATRVASYLPDLFRVATIGYGGCGSQKLPFHQYSWTFNDKFIIHDLPTAWEDFAGDEPGIMMTIQDPSRMLWFARPEACEDQGVAAWLQKKPFEKWGYFPIDASGPNGKLSVMLRECLLGYDRVLSYSKWEQRIIENTLGFEASEKRDLTTIPHGIDTDIFSPRNRHEYRVKFGWTAGLRQDIAIADDELLIGIVATNQARKDFGTAIATFAEISRKRKARLWIHTDTLDRYWSIPFLLADYGINGAMVTLDNFGDRTMAKLYSACDVTLGIGLGEGFGYPIFESLACGTPCIHGNYGGAPEWMNRWHLVPVENYRLEGQWNCVRPVFSPSAWAEKIEQVVRRQDPVCLPPELDWNNLWPKWAAWFKAGVERMETKQSCASA